MEMPTDPQVSEHHSILPAIIATAIVAAIVVAVVVWQLVPGKTTAPTTTPDQYADWKTYTSNIYEFKYPSDWILGESADNLTEVHYGNAHDISYCPTGYLKFAISGPFKMDSFYLAAPNSKEQNLISVDGHEAYRHILVGEESLCDGFGVMVKYDDNSYYNIDGQSFDGDLRYLDQILSTFKFTSGVSAGGTYNNDYFSVFVPNDWTVTQASKIMSYGNCAGYKTGCTINSKIETNPAAVNIRKGDYILYINAQASQASGVVGGRYGEIAQGAPSADTIGGYPRPPQDCYIEKTTTLNSSFVRHDLYTSTSQTDYQCARPADKSSAWFFSYIVGPSGGYFNYSGNNMSYVITMAYDSDDVNQFPKKDSTELNTMLNEMSSIATSLKLK